VILLDALFPPSPDLLVSDCRAFGAAGCWVYAARRDAAGADAGIGSWTPAHVDALHAAGMMAPAIIVPGDRPGDIAPMLDGVAALGCDPVTAWDIETASLPPAAWLAAAIVATRSRGWLALRYGDAPILAAYPNGDGDWLSHRGDLVVRAGAVEPVPSVPNGLAAWQYVVDVAGPHAGYDASVIDPNVFGGAMVDPGVIDKIDKIRESVNDQWAMAADGIGSNTGRVPIVAVVRTQLAAALAILTKDDQVLADLATRLDATTQGLAGLRTAVDALTGKVPPADLQPILDTLNRMEAGLHSA
jgi:hypothetical protein